MTRVRGDRGERRAGGRHVVEIGAGVAPELAGALLPLGWTVRGRAPDPGGLPDAGLLVLALADVAQALRSAGRRCVAVLCGRGGEEDVRRAAELTPFVYDAALPVRELARLLTAAAELAGRARRAAAPARATPSVVCIRLGESVEIDGSTEPLGLAERNFLYLLASSSRAIVAKSEPVPTEPGRSVKARECRRRLGKRLGPELASLLVPERRGEPYALRSPEEHERLGRLRLRIVGRSSVRSVSWSDLDGVPER